jgi:hypothetical protein
MPRVAVDDNSRLIGASCHAATIQARLSSTRAAARSFEFGAGGCSSSGNMIGKHLAAAKKR